LTKKKNAENVLCDSGLCVCGGSNTKPGFAFWPLGLCLDTPFFFFPPIHFASARHQCQLLFTPDPGHSFAACVQKDYLFLFLSSFHPANGRGVYKSWKQSLLVTLPLTHTHCPWADAFSPDVFLTQILFGIFSKTSLIDLS
jgi:hypothetical protein